MAGVEVGDKAPDFTLVDTWDHVRKLDPGRETTPALIVFFKASCPTCQLALPFLDRLFQVVEGKPVRFFGIAQEEKFAAQRFAVDYGIKFPLALDMKPYRASRSFGFTYVPVVFLIEPDGRIARRIDGFVRPEYEALAADVARRLGLGKLALFRPEDRVPALQPG